MAASITHRATGVALYFGTFLIGAWLIALGTSPECFETLQTIIASIPGKIILFLWTVAILFHFANGIRHLVWDGPRAGFDPKTASAVSLFNYAFAVLGAVAIFAATVWL